MTSTIKRQQLVNELRKAHFSLGYNQSKQLFMQTRTLNRSMCTNTSRRCWLRQQRRMGTQENITMSLEAMTLPTSQNSRIDTPITRIPSKWLSQTIRKRIFESSILSSGTKTASPRQPTLTSITRRMLHMNRMSRTLMFESTCMTSGTLSHTSQVCINKLLTRIWKGIRFQRRCLLMPML